MRKIKPTIAKKDNPVHFMEKDKQAEIAASAIKKYAFLEPAGASLNQGRKYKDKNPKNNRKISIKVNFDCTKIALSNKTRAAPKKAAFFDRPIFNIR